MGGQCPPELMTRGDQRRWCGDATQRRRGSSRSLPLDNPDSSPLQELDRQRLVLREACTQPSGANPGDSKMTSEHRDVLVLLPAQKQLRLAVGVSRACAQGVARRKLGVCPEGDWGTVGTTCPESDMGTEGAVHWGHLD